MGNANMNTTDANAGLAALVDASKPITTGSDEAGLWLQHERAKALAVLEGQARHLAAEVIRLTQINADLTAANAALMVRVEEAREVVELMDGELWAPERNCACHIHPPCRDCVEHNGTRDAKEAARAWLAGGAE
jgi:hypothetical protein